MILAKFIAKLKKKLNSLSNRGYYFLIKLSLLRFWYFLRSLFDSLIFYLTTLYDFFVDNLIVNALLLRRFLLLWILGLIDWLGLFHRLIYRLLRCFWLDFTWFTTLFFLWFLNFLNLWRLRFFLIRGLLIQRLLKLFFFIFVLFFL